MYIEGQSREVGMKTFCARHTCDLVVSHCTAHERPIRYLNVHRIEDNQRACEKIAGKGVRGSAEASIPSAVHSRKCGRV
jgi:hypothetical protein